MWDLSLGTRYSVDIWLNSNVLIIHNWNKHSLFTKCWSVNVNSWLGILSDIRLLDQRWDQTFFFVYQTTTLPSNQPNLYNMVFIQSHDQIYHDSRFDKLLKLRKIAISRLHQIWTQKLSWKAFYSGAQYYCNSFWSLPGCFWIACWKRAGIRWTHMDCDVYLDFHQGTSKVCSSNKSEF